MSETTNYTLLLNTILDNQKRMTDSMETFLAKNAELQIRLEKLDGRINLMQNQLWQPKKFRDITQWIILIILSIMTLYDRILGDI